MFSSRLHHQPPMAEGAPLSTRSSAAAASASEWRVPTNGGDEERALGADDAHARSPSTITLDRARIREHPAQRTASR
jgi:hypothetical protein